MWELLYETFWDNASEIGQLLSLPPGTVRSRLAQIRHRLKTELTEE